MDYLELPLALFFALLATYVLAILLRVSCHFCGVEIPTLGRAIAIVLGTVPLSSLALLVIQTLLVGYSGRRLDAFMQFLALVLALVAHMFITTAIYAPGLRVRYPQAFNVWLVQAAIFAGLAVVLGCCFAGVLAL